MLPLFLYVFLFVQILPGRHKRDMIDNTGLQMSRFKMRKRRRKNVTHTFVISLILVYYSARKTFSLCRTRKSNPSLLSYESRNRACVFGVIGAFQGQLNPISARRIFETYVIPTLLIGCENGYWQTQCYTSWSPFWEKLDAVSWSYRDIISPSQLVWLSDGPQSLREYSSLSWAFCQSWVEGRTA